MSHEKTSQIRDVGMSFRFDFTTVLQLSRKCLGMALLACLAALSSTTLDAQAPRSKSTSAEEPKSAVNEAFAVKAEHGPWFVMAMSFSGPIAKEQSEKLALELRKDFQLQAYCLSKRFDYTQGVEGVGFNQNGEGRKMKFRDAKVVEGYAVLVGDFDSIDSPAIKETLDKIKRITPRMMANGGEPIDPKSNSVDVSTYRKYLQKLMRSNEKETDQPPLPLGPMSGAFITRNPLLPADYYKAPVLDKFVKSLNEQKGLSEFSLLDCAGKFSVRIVVFRGEDQTASWGRSTTAMSDQDKISQLDIAAERATLTVRALRLAGYEAYQFHDRTQSYVTVGSFDELGSLDKQNRLVFSEGIKAIVERFGATKQVTKTMYGYTQTPRLLLDLVNENMLPELTAAKDGKTRGEWLAKYSVAFDLTPSPMSVPRTSSSSIYGGSFLGKRDR